MTAFAVAVPLDDERRLDADAARHGHTVVARCSGADELAARLPAVDADAVLVAAAPQYLNPRLIEACDEAGMRLVVIATAVEQERYARSVGIVDALPGELDWLTVAGEPAPTPVESANTEPPAIVSGERAEDDATEKRGTVIAVWGPAGAPGRTSIAIAIAAELAEIGLRVALADADTHAASIDPALGLLDEAPGFAAACRLASTGALTSAEFERVAQWHPSGRSGFWVLTGLGRPSRWPELTSERVAGVLTAARTWVDVLVVDASSSLESDEELSSDLAAPRRNAAAITAVRSADRIIAVGAADPIGLARYLRAHADLVEWAAPHTVTTVINKVRASAIGLNPAGQISQTLARFGGITDPVLVPWDPAALDAALLSGRALLDAAPRSAVRVAIRALVHDRLSALSHSGRVRRRRALSRAGAG